MEYLQKHRFHWPNPYSDWTCRTFSVDEQSLMLITNTTSLYSILVPANGLENWEQFLNGFSFVLEKYIVWDGLEEIFTKYINPELDQIQLSKSLNRTITGSMSDMIKLTELMFYELTLDEIAMKLNKTPFKAIGYDYSRDQFVKLLK